MGIHPSKLNENSKVVKFLIKDRISNELDTDSSVEKMGTNVEVYEGNLVDGLHDGYGTLFSVDGTVYKGQFKAGLCHGLCSSCIYFDGDTYEGSFKDGKYDGHGKYSDVNGDVFEGNFSIGQKSGYGISTYSNGTSYAGNFKHGFESGYGLFTYADGSTYDGLFEDGKQTT